MHSDSADAAGSTHLIDDDAGIRATARAHASHRRARHQDGRVPAAGVLRARVRATRRLRDRAGAGLLSRGDGDPRRAGVPHGVARAGRRGHGERLPPPARHRRARRRHHREAPEVGVVPARHPQRRRGGAARARGHRRGPGPLPAGGAAARSAASGMRGRRYADPRALPHDQRRRAAGPAATSAA